MNHYEITEKTKNDIYIAVRVIAENAEQAKAYYMELNNNNVNVVGCIQTYSDVKPSQTIYKVPKNWHPYRAQNEGGKFDE